MSGRNSKHEEFAFGSESFLDVIANIVGILIILIAIIGLKLKDAPPTTSERASAAKTAAAEIAERRAEWERRRDEILANNAARREAADNAAAELKREMARRELLVAERRGEQEKLDQKQHERDQEAARRRKILAQYEREAQRLALEIAGLENELDDRKEKAAAESAKREQTERTLLAHVQERIDALKPTVDEQSARLDEHSHRRDDLHKLILKLRAETTQIVAKNVARKQWVHYASPISKRIGLDEAQYRCMNGKIVDTHLDELLKRIGPSVKQSDLETQTIIRGVVGPVGGFRLRFMLQKESNAFTSAVLNPYSYRIELVSCELVPESNDLGETETDALANGSEFLNSIARRRPDEVAITLWVYPDSFGLAKAVQTRLHEMGYTVAMRPLPFGHPIAASPQGSASQGQ